ncbi:MAG: hypothetical protein PHS82_07420 [Lachnospiraceae bacterium]|nr:hypothetical protein [Lachnospiraceae bacterium]
MMHTILTNFKQNKFHETVENFMDHHPCVDFLALIIGVPMSVIIAVSVCTTAIMVPIAWLMGWI